MSSPTAAAAAPSAAVFPASGANTPKKQEYFARLENMARKHSTIMLVEADNVGSRQMAEIRLALRDRAVIFMGKNTMIRTCLRQMVADKPELQSLIDIIRNNVGMVFCQDEPSAIRKKILEFTVPAPAKMGAIAPCDVHIPPGPTGMDPGQTSFFQSLGIPTKIVKGQIEMQNDVHIIKMNERVNASQAVLLNKLNIKPFAYGLKTTLIWEDGVVYPAKVLDVSTDDIVSALRGAVQQVAALSLGTGMPTKCSVPHSILNAFRKVAGVAIACNFIFPEIELLKEALDNPGAFAAAAPAKAAPAAAAAAAAAPAAEEEEEEDGDFGFGLFD